VSVRFRLRACMNVRDITMGVEFTKVEGTVEMDIWKKETGKRFKLLEDLKKRTKKIHTCCFSCFGGGWTCRGSGCVLS
jgi:hypothetical protein